MNFLTIKAGEPMEVGAQNAFRMWRYVFPPAFAPVRVLSFVSDLCWPAHEFVESNPDVENQGIHAFKNYTDMLKSFEYVTQHLVMRSQISGCDGVVFGTVDLWGVIWEHAKGYRAQYARPTAFMSAYGNRPEQALVELEKHI